MAAIYDYVDALYKTKPDLIDRSIDTSLKKLGYYRQSPADKLQVMPMDFASLRNLAATGDSPSPRS